MATYKTHGIILRSQNFQEADKILTILLSRFGKIKAIAKAIRKPKTKLSGFLEPNNFLFLQLAKGKTFDIITDARIENNFSNIRNNLSKTSQAFVLRELCDLLLGERHANYAALMLLKNCLGFINFYKHPSLILFFKLNLLKVIGFGPRLESCLFCGKRVSPNWFFSFKEGGIIDKNCQNRDSLCLPIDEKTIKLTRVLLSSPVTILLKIRSAEKEFKQLAPIADRFLEYISERESRAEKFYQIINHSQFK